MTIVTPAQTACIPPPSLRQIPERRSQSEPITAREPSLPRLPRRSEDQRPRTVESCAFDVRVFPFRVFPLSGLPWPSYRAGRWSNLVLNSHLGPWLILLPSPASWRQTASDSHGPINDLPSRRANYPLPVPSPSSAASSLFSFIYKFLNSSSVLLLPSVSGPPESVFLKPISPTPCG